jgi:hypothetical protein
MRNPLGHDGIAPAATSTGHGPDAGAGDREHEVHPMHDDSVLAAVDAALSAPAFCMCGEQLALTSCDDAIWLECAAFTRPSRLPALLAGVLHTLGHDRRFVIELPAAVGAVPVPASAGAVAACAIPTPG